jgi:Stage II sporulation protein E (SpoIIE)
VSGDGWAVTAAGPLAALVVDGLGHGPGAAAAAAAALGTLADGEPGAPGELVRRAHEAMRGTRGGVLAAAVIDTGRGEFSYAGLGNISGRLIQGRRSRGLVSREGTAGSQLPLPSPLVTGMAWDPGSVLILTSDGIRSHWDPLAYPGLLNCDPLVTATVIYRDHERGTDDATVLVVRDARHGSR